MRDLHASPFSPENRSPGSDGAPYTMLKYVQDESHYNEMWKNSFFAVAWIFAIIISVLKCSKNSSSVLHYRSITLTVCMMKLFQKIVWGGDQKCPQVRWLSR